MTIQAVNISKSYRTKAGQKTVFENLNVTIKSGESIAILGRNGAGKSTLLRILSGIEQPDSGRVISDEKISWPVGTSSGFQGSLTARENVRFVAKIYGKSRDVNSIVQQVQEFADIGDSFDAPFRGYSSGMKARVAFGLSMAIDFSVYIMDEITAFGDADFRNKAAEAISKRQERASFLMVSHDLWGLRLHCDHAFVLEKGALTRFDSIKEAIKCHTDTLGVVNKHDVNQGMSRTEVREQRRLLSIRNKSMTKLEPEVREASN
ncbi:ABC transporter ATP-binding protein [Cyanobium sp. Morenito 9A2]|uniref:ABC transporter ATP-binding protein n=1 Tax=Cyanobium sp. Morenito 9A2 TaxID=2823718 RepID=UPI0020CE2DA6|nr:ABC transporter ATP-binding protein [Cyanobium sp. Morenito 9A2]MCP9851227.1 ABC transporter ATP-binding protein [Cyanobium sp. Morenito 9A2]